jgi:hypothetical protein
MLRACRTRLSGDFAAFQRVSLTRWRFVIAIATEVRDFCPAFDSRFAATIRARAVRCR